MGDAITIAMNTNINKYGNTFNARFAGICAECDKPIRAGEQVHYRYSPSKLLCHAKIMDCGNPSKLIDEDEAEFARLNPESEWI